MSEGFTRLEEPPRAPRPPPVRPTRGKRTYRAYLATLCVANAVAASLMLLGGDAAQPFAAAFGALGLLSLAAFALPPTGMRRAIVALLMVLPPLIAALALATGWGLQTPGLTLLGLIVCALTSALGVRLGATLAAVAAASVGVVAALAPPVPAPAPPLAVLLGTHGIAITVGLACGWLVWSLFQRMLARADERQLRFAHLLALSADTYWETDARHQLTVTAHPDPEHPGGLRTWEPRGGLGVPIWQLPQFHTDPDALDRLQADMQAQRPFRDLPMQWDGHSLDAAARSFLLCGEPRFDAHGVLLGYWGVSRDVTEMRRAQDALAAVETRYQDLFAHVPSALVLHRAGIVIDANAAALRLFDRSSPDGLEGRNLFDSYSDEARARSLARLATLDGLPLGTPLPVIDIVLQVGERRVPVRATSVRVHADGGPAVLSIFVDESERMAAEVAVRRSEALLSHLVATSPDLITLTEMDSGRYAMVNAAFEKMSGWSSAESVGRTSLELGIWADPAERERMVTQLREHGSVSHLPLSFRTRSGALVPLLISAARFQMDARDYLVINARDMTEIERQRLEREAILANASIGIALTRQGRFVLANRHLEAIVGVPEGGLLGQSVGAMWAEEAEFRQLAALLRPALAAGETVEVERETRRRDGSSYVVRVKGRVVDPARPREGGVLWIVEDVTERRQFERALARAKDEAEAASRAKSAFLANTSHELRTPLNGLLGLASLARDPGLAETQRRAYLDQILASGQALAAIISDILDLSKIEAGKLEIESAPFDLAAELKALHPLSQQQARARGLVLGFELAPNLGRVRGDALRLRQIVGNFLGNAVKFTPRGQIRLRARRATQPGWVRIEVQDTGPGIDPATQARLFRPFTQADESTTRRYGGTGLGLSICRELAALMGGRVGVISQVGRGSLFWLELPLPEEPEFAVGAPDAAASSPAEVQAREQAHLAGRRVLMVEDNPVNMLIAVALLERWGLVVGQAGDGSAALEAVAQGAAQDAPWELVLMDVQMPLMSGHEATRALRAAGHSMPVIALTAAALVSERDEALASGMNDFLTKPIESERLKAALLRWLPAPGPAPGAAAAQPAPPDSSFRPR